MTKKNQNVAMISGDHHTITITIRDEDDVVVDITGFTIWWWASRLSKSGSFSSTKSIEKDNDLVGGLAITNPAGGIVQVSLVPASTRDLSGDFHHEAQTKDLSGNISTVTIGLLEIDRDLVTAE